MAVYVYDNNKVDIFVSEDKGSVTTSATNTADYGNITDTADDDRGVDNFNPWYFGLITDISDVLPFGKFDVGGDALPLISPDIHGSGLFRIEDIAEVSYVTPWRGSGTLFEIGGGLERLVIPDLGAAGPSPSIYGQSQESNTFVEVGSGILAQLSDEGATDKFNRYPWDATGTLTLSGYNGTIFPDDFIAVIKNVAKVKGVAPTRVIYDYSLDPDTKFDAENYGFVSSTSGGKFSDAYGDLTFDRIITKNKDRSFSDDDQLEYENLGNIAENTQQKDLPVDILPDDLVNYQVTYTNTQIQNSGDGTGQTGGFAIGKHVKFGTAAGSRQFYWRFDTTNSDYIKFSVIRGNDVNGGEDPDQSDESLFLDRWDGSSWIRIDTVCEYNDTSFNSLKEVSIPLTAQEKGDYFYRLRQDNSSNNTNWDHYGVTSITYDLRQTFPIDIEDRGVIERKLGGGLFMHDYQATGIRASESIPFAYLGTGSLFALGELDPEKDVDQVFGYAGSGGFNVSGENFFSQAPQSTVFGLEGEFTLSGSGVERFVPATVDNTVLFNQVGSADDRIIWQAGERKVTIRPIGFGSVLLSDTPPTDTATLSVSGAATNIERIFADGNVNLFDISGDAGNPLDSRFTLHFRSARGDVILPDEDWGLIINSATEFDDWGYIREVATTSLVFGDILSPFNYIQIGGQHYPSTDTFSVGESSLTKQTLGFTGIATFRLSEDSSLERTFDYESSGITGIATYKAGINIFGYNWFSQAPQSTVFGLEGEFTLGGSANESITPFIEPQGTDGNFTFLSGLAETRSISPALSGDVYIGGTADIGFSPAVIGVGIATLRTGREEFQTYLRIIDPDMDLVLTTIGGGLINEDFVKSYNESSIYYGPQDEDYGHILNAAAYGMGLNFSGAASNTETFDDETNSYDQDVLFSNNGLTYDQSSGGTNVLPSFDKTESFPVNFGTTVVSEDLGTLTEGNPIPGGPAYDQYLYPNYTGFIDQDIDQGYDDFGFINITTDSQTRVPFGRVDIEQPPNLTVTRFVPQWNGSGTIIPSGTAEERFITSDGNTVLFDFIGTTSPEKFIAQTPEDTILLTFSGAAEDESVTFSEVGIGTAYFSGTGVESARFVEIGTGILSFSGAAVERSSMDPPEGTYLHVFSGADVRPGLSFASQTTKATQRLFGELSHPDIDFTPHYGIERNIGIETAFTLASGGGLNEDGTGPGIVTTRYLPDYVGSGLLTLSGKAIGRTNAPIFTDGTIYILGIHTAAQGISSGRETGLTESYSPGTIFGGPGQVTFKGISPTRPIQVFGYYGDDRNPGAGTTGVISIDPAQEGIVIKSTDNYVGVGTAYFSGAYSDLSATFREIGTGELFKFSALYERRSYDYTGSGLLTASGTTDAPSSFQTPENTVLFAVSGDLQERVSLDTETGGTITIFNTERVITGITLSIATGGTFSFFSGGAESIVIPSETTTALFDIEGIGETREIQVYGYYGDDRDPGTSGTITIVGELTHPQIDFTPAETGFGDLTFVGESIVKVDLRIVGKGTLTLSGTATEKFVSGAGEDTILFSIDGDGETALNSVYGYYGDDKDPGTSGQATFSGIGDTKKITVYGYYGDDKDPGTSGTFTFSNTPLVHPEVDYTPHYTGRGVINFTGGVAVKRTFPEVVGSGSLFGFGTKDEAYARTTYVGVGVAGFFGTAFTETISFEPARVYVTII
jgi:hypothetical protein